MRPLEALTGAGGGPAPRNRFNAERERQGGFELIFNEARQRETSRANASEPLHTATRRADPNRAHHRHSSEAPPDTNETPAAPANEAPAVPDETPYAEAPATPYETPQPPAAALYETAYVNPLSYVPATEVITAVAEALQLPTELVQELLLPYEPQQLTEPQAVTALLQEVYQAETPAALLTEPEFPNAYKAVNEALAKLAQPETAAPQAAADITANTAEVAAARIPVIDGLQYAVQDGELTVTDLLSAEEETVTITRATTAANTANASQSTTQPAAQPAAEATPLEFAPAEAAADPAPPVTAPMTEPAALRAEATQNTQQSAQAQQVNPADVMNQIMDQIRVHTGEQVTEMRLTLRPQALGDIVLRVLTQNGIVTAQFIAESQRVREALEANFNQLREALEEQGIQFSELSVSVRQNSGDRQSLFEQGRSATRHRAESVIQLDDPPDLTDSIDFDHTVNFTA